MANIDQISKTSISNLLDLETCVFLRHTKNGDKTER